MSETLCLDFERQKVYEVDPGLILTGFTERHHVNSIPLVVSELEFSGDHSSHNVIINLQAGLPTRAQISTAKKHLRQGKAVYFYWPEEDAIEVITHERLRSFKRHVRFHETYQRVSNLRNRRVARKVAKATEVAGDPSWGFVDEVDDGYRVQGRGMYIRLDYWAKLTAGGSYGHTCYQVKALDNVCSDGMICVFASEYQLLREMDIHQIVIPSRTEMADEYSLVENGVAYEQIIESLIEFYRPRLVFERLVLGNDATAKACKKFNIPYIAEFNGSELTMSRIFGGREMANAENLQAIETNSFLQADVVSTVSDPVSEMVFELGISSEKVLTNPNGVDLEAYGPLPLSERLALRQQLGFADEEVVLGFCGTFGGWHGIEVLADAIPQICAAADDVKFLLIGDGGFKHLVLDQIDAHNLQARVVDLGLVEQTAAAKYLAVCDVLLSPHSKNMGDKPFFGSPTKLFEYMAYGVGIVCSDLVQLGEVMRPALTLKDRELTAEGARSVLIEPGSVDDLVSASLWLIQSPELRRTLGANARNAAERFYSWDTHVQTLLQFVKGKELEGYHLDRKNL